MDTNLIEQYVINEIEKYKTENEQLKQRCNDLEKENFKLKTGMEKTDENYAMPALGVVYDIKAYSYEIEDNNIEDYKRALQNKDFAWLKEKDYYIVSYAWNYEIKINGVLFRLDLTFESKYMEQSATFIKGKYSTQKEAKEALLKQLAIDIKKKENE